MATENKTSAKKDAAKDLQELFMDSLKDIYWAEQELTKALPKMSKNATSEKLKKAIDEHLEETKGQVDRLKKVFELEGKKAEGKKCEAMAGIVEEGEEILKETEPGAVRDAGIIAASQKVEHYEIATYGTLLSWAKLLGKDECVKILKETMDEEKSADDKLTELAKSEINEEAVA